MVVLSAFADGSLRFSDLETELNIAPNTLSTRSEELTGAGLLNREAYDEVPPRVEYTLTEVLSVGQLSDDFKPCHTLIV